jgi:hypothetical protein
MGGGCHGPVCIFFDDFKKNMATKMRMHDTMISKINFAPYDIINILSSYKRVNPSAASMETLLANWSDILPVALKTLAQPQFSSVINYDSLFPR